MMHRRNFLRAASAAAMALAARRSPSAGAPRRPNILYVLTDQWRASALGYTGDPNVKTPVIDALAAQSIDFRTAVSVCPVCTPYRAALLTGRYPTSTGMFLNDLHLPDGEVCLAESLKAAGYTTGYIGKWHLDGHGRAAFVPPARRQGFDYWKGAECDHNYPRSHYYEGDSPEKKIWEGYDAYAQTDDARRFLSDHAADDRPFFLMVSYGTPHFPHGTAPDEFKARIPPESIRFPPNVPAEKIDEKLRREAQGYYAHCMALDRCVERLLASLRENGLERDTILVFTSDHGEMMGSQGCPACQKQVPWDESILVPFLLRYPALHGAQGRVVRTPIVTPDILPTLLSLAGVPVPPSVEGEDLSAILRGGGPEDRAVLFMNVAPFDNFSKGREYRGVRTARHTYVRAIDGPWLLYDNQADPHQMRNLVDDPAAAELKKDLEGKLKAALKRAGDDFKPKAHYLAYHGYRVRDNGAIPYGPEEGEVQSPRR